MPVIVACGLADGDDDDEREREMELIEEELRAWLAEDDDGA